jgi:CDP-diacylglycerol--serine O-phosphatidyltransferase
MERIVRQIPNAFTLANLFIGCLAIAYLFYDHLYITVVQSGGVVSNIDAQMPRVAIACYLVYAATALDFVDGFLARTLKAQSAIGQQLDSLADLVTFGLVPGLMMFQLTARAYYQGSSAFSIPMLLFSSGFLVTLAAAWRLARFNTEEHSGSGFSGLATPAMAGLVASLPMIAESGQAPLAGWLDRQGVILGIAVLMAFLMVSKLPLLGLKVPRFDLKQYPWELGGMLSGWALLLSGIFVFQWAWATIPICFAWYLLLSLGHGLFAKGESA